MSIVGIHDNYILPHFFENVKSFLKKSAGGRRSGRGWRVVPWCGIMVSGSVAEWLKAHDSKSCKCNSFGGSNPLASAIRNAILVFFLSRWPIRPASKEENTNLTSLKDYI